MYFLAHIEVESLPHHTLVIMSLTYESQLCTKDFLDRSNLERNRVYTQSLMV